MMSKIYEADSVSLTLSKPGANGLGYAVPGNASPQGKPKIYFCCTSGDFRKYFNNIATELLEIQRNACVWFRDPACRITDEKQLMADLREMQLFVIPVTSDFLYGNDRARTIELAFALKNHIPVLPLMQEPGLDRDFNRICGDLQFLDHNAGETDPTALSYDEKLKKFLGSVIVGDEMAKRVRNAFDAYIFLSYRKKDRAAAQNVMRLIHSSDFARDIAIWYDEFLTPGENFNDEIEAAMKKSILFALVVTPNILEDPNYVQTTEYPAAVDMRMTILPVEAEDTDAAELARMYSGLAVSASAADPETIAKRLHELLVGIALRKNDADPVHNYLIGLAYLTGLDVEADHERALSLISGAADAGLDEAYEKLVAMYRTGDGVGRSYNTAIDWQRKYIASLQKRADAEDDLATVEKLAGKLSDLGDYEREAGDASAAKTSYMKCVRSAWKAERGGGIFAHSILFGAYYKLGSVCIADKEFKEAREWYSKCMAASMFTFAESNSRHDMALAYDGLADVSLAEGDIEKAKKLAEKSLDICLEEANQQGEEYSAADMAALRKNLMICYIRLGEICQTAADLQGAKDWYLRCIDSFKTLADETGDANALRDLAICYNRIGRVCSLLGQDDEAREWLNKGLEKASPVLEKTDTIESKRDLALNYNRLGDVALAGGKRKEARKYYEKSLALIEEAAAGSSAVLDRQVLSITYLRMGGLCNVERNFDEAETWYRKSIDISTEIFEETGALDARRDVCIGCLSLGRMLCGGLRRSEGEDYLDECIETGEEADDQSIEILKVLAIAYAEKAKAGPVMFDRAEVISWYEKSIEANEKIAAKAHTEEVLRNLADSLGELAGNSGIPRKKRRRFVTRLSEVLIELYELTGKKEYREKAADAEELLAALQPSRVV